MLTPPESLRNWQPKRCTCQKPNVNVYRIAAFLKLIQDDIQTILYITVIERCYCGILPLHKHALQLKKRHLNNLIKDSLKSKIMNSRPFLLHGVGCKIVNCTQVAKTRKLD